MHTSSLLALAASVSTALGVSQGFNYGAVNSDGSNRFQADFQREFTLAQSLPGASGFNSARLYTMIQGGSSTNEPIQAIPAAIATRTTLLLGLWASGGDGFFAAEITALQTAIRQWGSSFTDLVVGISVGSEDLYRISEVGIKSGGGFGAEPATVARYITQLRAALQGTALAGASIGHVDTWTAWVNGTNQAVIDAVDWVGVDAYPYFQNTEANAIANGESLFQSALDATTAAVGGKELWITETGWPVSGPTENQALANPVNAKRFWDEAGCPRFGRVNVFWYTLQDATPTLPSPSFGIVGSDGKPVFDLSCSAVSSSSSSSAASSATSSIAASGTATTSDSGSAATSGGSVASSASSIASSASSVASSVASSIASNPPVSSGGGLSPSQGGGVIVPSLTQGSGPFPTTNSSTTAIGGQPSVSLVTQTTLVGGGAASSTAGAGGASASPSTTGAPLQSEGGASTLAASFVGALGAVFAAVLAL